MRYFLLIVGLFALSFVSAGAVSHRIFRDDIRTLRTEVAGQLETLTVVRLGSTEVVEVSFD